MKDNSKTRELLAKLRRFRASCSAISKEYLVDCLCPSCTEIENRLTTMGKAIKDLKERLKTLPHVPNKQEAKQLRKDRKKKGK